MVFTDQEVVTNFPATQPVSAASLPLPANAAQESGGHLAAIDSHTPANGQATMANSRPVAIASDQTAIPVTVNIATTSTVTRVAVTTSNTVLSAADGTKRRVILFAEGAVFIKLGVTASATSYTYSLANKGTVEIDNFSGEIDAISPAGTVPVQVTELR